ncbi:hypothetical protein HGG75_10855 [Ochrobactrum pseudogrignonense]|nr:hypothetical protein [Brucella pseudogrignonensis]
MSNTDSKNSAKSMNSSAEQRKSWGTMIRISLALSLLRCGRSLALWIAPELANPMAKTGIIQTLVEWAIVALIIVFPPLAVAVVYAKWVA